MRARGSRYLHVLAEVSTVLGLATVILVKESLSSLFPWLLRLLKADAAYDLQHRIHGDHNEAARVETIFPDDIVLEPRN